tara:strand:+ start:10552 stop:10710 length:159 start_codon:yes stop_codon:yes gene_type:complete
VVISLVSIEFRKEACDLRQFKELLLMSSVLIVRGRNQFFSIHSDLNRQAGKF